MSEGVLTYSVLSGSALGNAEWDEVSELFSCSYGFYSQQDPAGRAGRRIRLSSNYYRRAYATDDYQVARCRDEGRLVAEAVFRVRNTSRGRAAFVVQLVVDERYRRRGIASTLLHAIWGFSDDADNKAVLASVSANLRSGGYAVLSVSNYGYVAGKGAQKVDLDDPVEATRRIFELPPSQSMETTGEFFNPNYILLDDKHHIACRKEQFSSGTGLPGEYLLCDRRFTSDEIRTWAESCGLVVTESRFVRAGFDAEFDATTGKEILLITKKR